MVETEVMVSFDSDPTACDVVIDGIYVGATPLEWAAPGAPVRAAALDHPWSSRCLKPILG